MNKNNKQKLYPRVIVAGTSSGVGKTTISLAIMAALSKKGFKVQGFKVGPDFIDPGYYQLATGRAGRNLDTWMMGKRNTLASFTSAASEVDVSIIEGVMGLYDGRGALAVGSTAEVAKLIDSPVIVVIDCAKMGASAGAVALGYLKYDESVSIKGFILNRIGSKKHEEMVKRSVESATGLPVLGCVRKAEEISIPERHLGLVTQEETRLSSRYIEALAEMAERSIDIEATIDIAVCGGKIKTGLELSQPGFDSELPCLPQGVKIGVAYDKAFSFYYHDNFDLLKMYGAELAFFSPLSDRRLPDGIRGLYLGGGYPEVYAAELSNNRNLADEIKDMVESGLPVYAECGGLIYLAQAVDGFDNKTRIMSKALPLVCKMQNGPTLGYREVIAITDSVIASKGDILRGHEFHYSTIAEVHGELKPAYKTDNGSNEGFIYKNTLASYIHLHFAGQPEAAGRFVLACRRGSYR
ncbi:MAG: cobyrinate a,c-diamide synthase [Firmicutes bacterium]|nr:cobyrinate a,c-diamide synthase [Bacillota bacterium]